VRRRRGSARRKHRGGHAMEAHVENAEEERETLGVWRGNDRFRV
jgi:hypothetical protein